MICSVSDLLEEKVRPIVAALFGLIVTLVILTGCGVSRASSDVDPASTVTPPAPLQSAAASTAVSPSKTPSPTRPPTPVPMPTATSRESGSEESGAATVPPIPTQKPDSTDQIEHVVLISIDGLRPDALEQADTPVLDSLRLKGAYSAAAQAVLPSVTLVNHASMLGGMSPEKHGISWNVNDPELGKINGPTLFSLAYQADLSTAMVTGKPKLEHIVLPNSVDNYIYAGFTDSQVINQALEVVGTGLPNILFIHLPDVDSTGHAGGWMSLIQLIAIGRTDGLVGEVIAALEEGDYLDRTLLIVTSDHGGSGKSHGSDSPADVTIPWLAVGPGVPAGLDLASPIMIYDTAATILYAFQLPIPEAWDGQPILEIFTDPVTQDEAQPAVAD